MTSKMHPNKIRRDCLQVPKMQAITPARGGDRCYLFRPRAGVDVTHIDERRRRARLMFDGVLPVRAGPEIRGPLGVWPMAKHVRLWLIKDWAWLIKDWVPEGSLAGFWGSAFLRSGRAPGARESLAKYGGLRTPHFGRRSWAPAGQTSKTHPKQTGQNAFRYPMVLPDAAGSVCGICTKISYGYHDPNFSLPKISQALPKPPPRTGLGREAVKNQRFPVLPLIKT